jgi:Na+(H+)/acetate symporter ActP
MQFGIVMLGALLFVFYQFHATTPVIFNQTQWQRQVAGPDGAKFKALEEKHATAHADKQEKIRAWVAAHDRGDAAAEATAQSALRTAQKTSDAVRNEARAALQAADPSAKRTKDSDYVFITFILTQLPHGVIGLLLAVMFASALSSKAGELNALGTTTTIDLWRSLRPLAERDEPRNVRNAKFFTAVWGVFAIGFALFVSFAENLIEALNIVASIFYPALLGVFVVAFFLKWVKGTAVFCAAIAAQLVVLVLYFTSNIAYLWLNPIGCATCVIFAVVLQAVIGEGKKLTADGHR